MEAHCLWHHYKMLDVTSDGPAFYPGKSSTTRIMTELELKDDTDDSP